MAKRAKELAVAYMRTSSAANVGPDKDSETRQREAIQVFAKRAGFEIVDWFYDPAARQGRHSEAPWVRCSA
jgi:DNA invertase Pin-like site-specific DNA recombinase